MLYHDLFELQINLCSYFSLCFYKHNNAISIQIYTACIEYTTNNTFQAILILNPPSIKPTEQSSPNLLQFSGQTKSFQSHFKEPELSRIKNSDEQCCINAANCFNQVPFAALTSLLDDFNYPNPQTRQAEGRVVPGTQHWGINNCQTQKLDPSLHTLGVHYNVPKVLFTLLWQAGITVGGCEQEQLHMTVQR